MSFDFNKIQNDNNIVKFYKINLIVNYRNSQLCDISYNTIGKIINILLDINIPGQLYSIGSIRNDTGQERMCHLSKYDELFNKVNLYKNSSEENSGLVEFKVSYQIECVDIQQYINKIVHKLNSKIRTLNIPNFIIENISINNLNPNYNTIHLLQFEKLCHNLKNIKISLEDFNIHTVKSCKAEDINYYGTVFFECCIIEHVFLCENGIAMEEYNSKILNYDLRLNNYLKHITSEYLHLCNF